MHELLATLKTVAQIHPMTEKVEAELEDLKDLLAVSGGVYPMARTREEAEDFAKKLNDFIQRHDVPTAQRWADSLKERK